jgi:hypothetical protein
MRSAMLAGEHILIAPFAYHLCFAYNDVSGLDE